MTRHNNVFYKKTFIVAEYMRMKQKFLVKNCRNIKDELRLIRIIIIMSIWFSLLWNK